MSKQARSARGQIVNFDVLAIKQQLAMQPVPVGVNLRRKFIDEKDGIKHRQENFIVPPAAVVSPVVVGKKAAPAAPAAVPPAELPSALAIAANAAATSAAAGELQKHNKKA